MTNVNLIDGTGAPARPHMTVVISDGHIQAVLDSAPGNLPENATLWNLGGKTIIPGLFDSHVHLTGGPGTEGIEKTLRWGFLAGVTSVRDMGGDNIELKELAQKASDAGDASPRIYFSTLVAGPAFFSDARTKGASHGGIPGEVAWMRSVTSQSDIPAIISAGKATGATGLKIYADLPPDLVNKLGVEAHRQGLLVWSHSAIFPTRPSEAVQAGVNVVSHSVYLGVEGMNKPPDSYEQARRGLGIDYSSSPVEGTKIMGLLRLMREHGTILDETLFVTHLSHKDDSDPIWLWTRQVTKEAHARGVELVAGTDSFGDPAKDAMPNIYAELELLVAQCGLTPIEAIRAATYSGAHAVGAERLYGTVEAGKAADLVVLRDDPSTDIRRARDVAAVLKAGVIYKRP
jgi:imidazolonepropionase-like amidohydrolase